MFRPGLKCKISENRHCVHSKQWHDVIMQTGNMWPLSSCTDVYDLPLMNCPYIELFTMIEIYQPEQILQISNFCRINLKTFNDQILPVILLCLLFRQKNEVDESSEGQKVESITRLN